MNRTISRLGLTGLALVAGAVAYAQSPTTGMISGKVTVSGSPTAGVKIILSGPALQGSRTVVTEADGSFRFSFVPSGQGYQLMVSKSGSETVSSKNITVEPWGNLARNFKLDTVGTTVVVTASAAQVDTTTVTQSVTLTSEGLKQLPLASREIASAVYLTPGVVDGGRGERNPNMGGGTAFENSYIVDGQNVTDPLLGENRTRINTLAVESIQVQSGGYEPEYGRSTGGIISVVTKTGSNEFKVDLETSFRPEGSIARATAQADLAFNARHVAQGNLSNTAIWLGGPIIKDKLWYSIGVSSDSAEETDSYGQVYFLDPQQASHNPLAVPAVPTGHTNNGTSYKLKSKFIGITGKLTYNVNTDNTLELGLSRNRESDDANNLGLTFSDLASTLKRHPQDVDTLSLNWRSVLTPSWLLDVRAATYKRKQYDDLNASQKNDMFVAAALPAYVVAGDFLADGSGPVFPAFPARAVPGIQFGGWGVDATNELTRKQFTAKGTNFVGSHTVKYGVDYDETEFKSFFDYTGGALVTRDYNVDPVTGDFISFRDTYRFRIGAGGHTIYKADGTHVVDNVLFPGQGLDLDSKSKNLALFAQDSWQITNKLLVIYGLRADSQKIYGGDGLEFLKFNFKDMTAPRFGITFDPTGAGKTKLSASYGRFYETVPMDLNQRAGSIEGFVQFRRTYSGANAIGGTFTSPTISDVFDPITGRLNTSNPANGGGSSTLRRIIGGAKSDVDPAIKPQSIEEIAFGWDQQLSDQWKFGAKWKYRYYKNVIEDFSGDFGNTYFLGNPGQRGLGLSPIQVDDYDYLGQHVQVSFPKPIRDYRELVMSIDKAKGADKWAFNASLTFATNIGNFAGLDSPLNGQADPNISSTFDLPVLMRNTYGALPNSPRYNFQATGTYDLGMGFMTGGRFLYRAGTAISALGPDLGGVINGGYDNDFAGVGAAYGLTPGQYLSFNGQYLHTGNYGDNEALLEPRGSRGSTPDVSRFDLHLEWSTQLEALRKAKLTIFMDVFNLFNQQMILTVNQTKQFSTTVAGAITDAQGVVQGPINPYFQGIIAVDNPRFLTPTSFQAPRSIQFGARLNF